MAYKIECSDAGEYKNVCKEGAELFRAQHPEEEWWINGKYSADGLYMTVAREGQMPCQFLVPRGIKMAHSVFTALERIRKELTGTDPKRIQ